MKYNALGRFVNNSSQIGCVEGTGNVDPNNLGYEETKEYIWKYLKNELEMSDMHAAVIMGNMQVESDFSPTNAQDGYGYPGVDNSDYIDEYEIKDGVGWGLIQWTFYTRKEGLQEYAEQQGKSVGDLNVQLEYLQIEVTTVNPYKKRYSEFLEINDLDKAVEYFCTEIEQAGVPHLDRRISGAEEILKKFGGTR